MMIFYGSSDDDFLKHFSWIFLFHLTFSGNSNKNSLCFLCNFFLMCCAIWDEFKWSLWSAVNGCDVLGILKNSFWGYVGYELWNSGVAAFIGCLGVKLGLPNLELTSWHGFESIKPTPNPSATPNYTKQ